MEDSVSSCTSFFEDDKNGSEERDFYSNSILISTEIKSHEDLVDEDLKNMLRYICRLELPKESEVNKRGVEFGEFTRHKTLVFDLDETLINSF